MAEIKIANNFSLSANDYANQGNSIIGIRGSGKTYTASKIAEELMKNNIPIIVFDPTGVWQNLRYGISENKGFPIVVAGGIKGDIELTEENVIKIISAALRENISLIIDLQGKATSNKSKWLRIVSNSIEYLMEHNQDYGLRHIFIEEAAEFVPQRQNPGGALTYSRIESMARMGRNYGLGYTLINQRAEEIAKAIFEISELVLVHRQSGKNSLKSIKDWLNYKGLAQTEIVKSLHKLDNGQCWAIDNNGETLINILPKETFHPDPKKGNITTPIINHSIDISDFIERMKDSLIDPVIKKTQKQDDRLSVENSQLKKEIEYLKSEVQLLSDRLNQINLLSAIEVKQVIEPVKPEFKPIINKANNSKPSSGQSRILNTCAMFYPESVTKSRIGLISNLSPNSGSFNTYLSNLKRDGLIEYENGNIKITKNGLVKAGQIERLPVGEDLINMWCSHIGVNSGAARILKYLASIYPNAKNKIEIGQQVELSEKSGSFNTYLSTLKRNGLIVSNGSYLKATDELFNN